MTDTQTLSASALVPTSNGSRYIQQLCKHWSHNLEVEFTAEHGRVTFPRKARGADHPGDAVATFDARKNGIEIHLSATSVEQLDGLKGAIQRHLDRFAYREAPLTFEWN